MKFDFGYDSHEIDVSSISHSHINLNRMKLLGFKDFKREIIIYIKESKNLNGIVGHDLITSLNVLITNYSISDSKLKSNGERFRHFNKTVYYCGAEFSNNITMEMIKRNPQMFLGRAEIIPYYGFSNSIVVLANNRFADYKLSVADLSAHNSNILQIINFSDNEKEPTYKEIVQGNHFNPMFYTILDANDNMLENKYRGGLLTDFIDDNTSVFFNTFGSSKVDNFVNNEQKTGIYINKNTIYVSEYIENLFNEIIFIHPDKLEFMVDYDMNINITKLTFFTNHRNDVLEYLTGNLVNSIKNVSKAFMNKINKKFKVIVGIYKQLMIIDILIDNKEIRITKPLYVLYGEFSMRSETILEDLEMTKNMIKSDYLEQDSVRLALGQNNRKIINSMFDMIEDKVNTIQIEHQQKYLNKKRLLE